MNIRTATLLDLDTINDIEAACFPPSQAASKRALKQRLEVFNDYFFLLLDDCQNIVGFINGMVSNDEHLSDKMYEDALMHDPNGDWQMVFGLDVLPTFQHQGYAHLLLNYLIEHAKKQNRKGVVLTCRDCLIGFYESFGFVNEGISASCHGDTTWYDMRLSF